MNKPLCKNLLNIDKNESVVYVSATEVEISGSESKKKYNFE